MVYLALRMVAYRNRPGGRPREGEGEHRATISRSDP